MTYDNGGEKQFHSKVPRKYKPGETIDTDPETAHYNARLHRRLPTQWDGTYWAYCHMKGQPCVWCNGRNAVYHNHGEENLKELGGELCPKGKDAGNAWFGCCDGPRGHRLIAFMDCCGEGFCVPNVNKVVNNWPQAKNWCFSDKDRPPGPPAAGTLGGHIGNKSYYCTVVVDVGECVDD
jgi:hypothetical protein